MPTSNTLFNNTSISTVLPYPAFVDSTTGSIQHFNGTKFVQIGGYTPTASGTVTLTSGTAIQNTAPCFATYYIFIGGNTGGTVSVAIGATSACANVIIPSSAANAANNHVLTIRVPSAWYLKVTVTNGATITANSTILTEGSF